MKMGTLLAAACVLVSSTLAHAENGSRERIAWVPSWDGAVAEAKRTGRPIMLVSAAPQCHNVSGIW